MTVVEDHPDSRMDWMAEHALAWAEIYPTSEIKDGLFSRIYGFYIAYPDFGLASLVICTKKW